MARPEQRQETPVHVRYRPEKEDWAVVREGNKKTSAVHQGRHQAEEHGRSLARETGTDFYLHDKDGQIVEHEHYGPSRAGERSDEGAARVTITRPDTGAVEVQVAHRHGETYTVQVRTYPSPEVEAPQDPTGRAPTVSDTYQDMSLNDMKQRYPELWEKIDA